MALVFDNVELPGSVYDVGARVEVALVASLTDDTVPGVISGSDISILDKYSGYTNGAGYVGFDLRRNDQISPSNSYYVWTTFFSDGRVSRRLIRVNGAGPYHVADVEISPAPAVSPFIAPLIGQGLEADRPSAATMIAAGGRTGWEWWSTDKGIKWMFDGTTWQIVGGDIGVLVERTTGGGVAQTMLTGVATTIDNFNSEIDPHDYHSGTSNALVVPTGFGGWHDIEGFIEFESNATGLRGALILRNGSVIGNVGFQAANGQTTRVDVSTKYRLVDGDSITLQGVQFSGGTRALAGGSPYARLAMTRC